MNYINVLFDEICVNQNDKQPGKIRKNSHRSSSVSNFASVGNKPQERQSPMFNKRVEHQHQPSSLPIKERGAFFSQQKIHEEPPSFRPDVNEFKLPLSKDLSNSPNIYRKDYGDAGYAYDDMRKSHVTGTPNRLSYQKNHIEINKNTNTTAKKVHKTYEKHLMNFDQHIRPLLETWKNNQFSSPTRRTRSSHRNQLSARSGGHSKRESITTYRAHDNELKIAAVSENLAHTASEMKIIYQEINNLTSQITGAALLMQNALEKLGQFKNTEGNSKNHYRHRSLHTDGSRPLTTNAKSDEYEGDYSEFTQ